MEASKFLKPLLLFMRLSVFVVMLIWALDKFIRPEHSRQVFEQFYFIKTTGFWFTYLVGALELIVIFGFLIGFAKFVTYGLVLVFHAISTFSTFPQYLQPFEGVNILFFAAWPMLAACLLLFVFRNHDTLCSIKKD